jgi:hypothetical protein
MSKLKMVTGLLCVLVGACAGANEGVRPAAVASASPAPRSAARAGFTRGSMQDPQAHEWQSDLLRAIGREGQYSLFDYVFVGDEANGSIYVGVRADALGLTPAQMEAADQVQQRYGSTKMGAATLDGFLIANAWPEANGAIASNAGAGTPGSLGQ